MGSLAGPGPPPALRRRVRPTRIGYYGALATARGQLLPYPAGEAPGPLGYVPWPDGIAAVLSRLYRKLPQAWVVVPEFGYGGTDDQARCTYLRQALEHIAAAQDAGMRIEGVTLWTGIDNYEWLAGAGVPFGLVDVNRAPRHSARFVHAVISTP